jgi:hypothetical protein
MAESFCQRVRLLLTRQWSHILKKPLKGCKAPINEAYLDQTRAAMRILWTEVLEGKGLPMTFSKVCPEMRLTAIRHCTGTFCVTRKIASTDF